MWDGEKVVIFDYQLGIIHPLQNISKEKGGVP